MTNVPKHDLIHEFPEFKDKIHQLKTSNAHFAKLFDASNLVPATGDHELLMLGARIRAYAQTMDSGPIAFVVRTTEARQIIDRYINLAQANRPAGVFFTVEDAKEWLAKQRR